MTSRTRPLLATLIDADNISAQHAEAILTEIAAIGEPALRRVYGDWSNPSLRSWNEKISELGLVANQQTANTTGKNANDIGLVIDAMDILHNGKFDGFVLVSSDSDFTGLAHRLREEGLRVIGIGEEKTPKALRNACNKFILIQNIIAGSMEKNAETPPTKKPNEAKSLILGAINRMQQDDDDLYNIGQIGQALSASHPDFDVRTYGASKLSDLLKAIRGFGIVRKDNQAFLQYPTE